MAGYRAMKELLKLGSDMPTALFVASDIQAFGVFKAAREYGVNIPDDIAIVGFDDIELAEFIGLSTLHQPIYEMGRLAVEKLLARIAGDNSPIINQKLKTDLIIRDSCGAKKTNKAMNNL
jgi:DNA-binding LacI/PurR family transcriptional regulator